MIGSCQLQHYEAVDPLAPPFSHENPHVTDSTRFIPKPPLCGDLNPHGNHHPICGLWKVFPCDYHCAWIHVKKSKVVYIESIIAPPFLLFSSHLLGGHGNFAKVEKRWNFVQRQPPFLHLWKINLNRKLLFWNYWYPKSDDRATWIELVNFMQN